jgi:hypothetical protein
MMPNVRALLAPFRFFAIAGLLTAAASADGITIYSGCDRDAWWGGPRPNSNAAAASFDAANPGPPIITFESAPLGWFRVNLAVAPGVTLDGVDYGGWGQFIRSMNPPSDARWGFNTTAGGGQWVSLLGGWVVFTFASPINAFGAYLSGVECCSELFRFNDGAPRSIGIVDLGTSGGVEFLGFSDTSPFSSVMIAANSDRIGVDDVRYGYARSAVPEPTAVVLLGAFLAVLGFSCRRLSWT